MPTCFWYSGCLRRADSQGSTSKATQLQEGQHRQHCSMESMSAWRATMLGRLTEASTLGYRSLSGNLPWKCKWRAAMYSHAVAPTRSHS